MYKLCWVLFSLNVYLGLTSDIVELKDANFKQVTAAEDHMLVEFYAPWCGHCQALEPEYETAATKLKTRGIKIGKVDATKEEKLAEKHGVSGYPTLKVFKNGEFLRDYKGPRTADGIVKYMEALADGEEVEDEPEDTAHDEEDPYGGEGEGEGDGAGSTAPAEELVGAVNLDSFTFDKLVGTDKFDVLVKFDTSYAYGDKENQWIKLSRRIANLTATQASQFLLGVVGIEDYGDKLNDDLRERFSVVASDFPVFHLFKRGSKEPVKYRGPVDADALAQFISQETGLWIGLQGCLQAFDPLAHGFTALGAEDRKQREAQATALLGALAEPTDVTSASYYVRVMRKVAEKGPDYPSAEASRIEKLLASKVSDDKKAEMQLRLNILTSFGSKAGGAAESTKADG